ncbi:uncharacterized protein [Rhodnius prolixus]|uniref:uncharacterized protein n=1 Tax=Rhodnius prolixus TaxID=13249 RepID=UPI003D1898AE
MFSTIYCLPQFKPNLYNIAPNVFNVDNVLRNNNSLQYYIPKTFNISQYTTHSLFDALIEEETNYNELYSQLQSLENNANKMGMKRLLVLNEIAKLHDIDKKYQESLKTNLQLSDKNKKEILNIKNKLRKLSDLENILFEKLYLKYKEKRNIKLEGTEYRLDFTQAPLTNNNKTVSQVIYPNIKTTLHFPRKRDFIQKYEIDKRSSAISERKDILSSRKKKAQFNRILGSFIRNAKRFSDKANIRKDKQIIGKVAFQLNRLAGKIKEINRKTFNKSAKILKINVKENKNITDHTEVYSNNKTPLLSKLNKFSSIFNNSKSLKNVFKNTGYREPSNGTNKLNSFSNTHEILQTFYNKIPSVINAFRKPKNMNVEKLLLMPLSIGIISKPEIKSTQTTDPQETATVSFFAELKPHEMNETDGPVNITALVNYNGREMIVDGTFYLSPLNDTILHEKEKESSN